MDNNPVVIPEAKCHAGKLKIILNRAIWKNTKETYKRSLSTPAICLAFTRI